MRLRQQYVVSGKPPNTREIEIASDVLERTAKRGLSGLARYLEENKAIRTDLGGKISEETDRCNVTKVPLKYCCHLIGPKGGLTIGVHTSTSKKDWLIEECYRTVPNLVDVTVEIVGDGSAEQREIMRKEVFGKKSRIIAKKY